MFNRFLLCCFVCFVCTCAQAATLKVGPGGQYSSIRSALDAALDGDTLQLAPGTYRESIVIQKEVSIKGTDKQAQKSVIEGEGTLLTIRGLRKSTIENITIKATHASQYPLVHVTGTGNKFAMNDITLNGGGQSSTAILVNGSGLVHFDNIVTRSFVKHGWKIENEAKIDASSCQFNKIGGIALAFSGNTSGIFKRSQISHSPEPGIEASGSAKIQLDDTSLIKLKYAFSLDDTAQLTLNNVVVDEMAESSHVRNKAKLIASQSTFLNSRSGAITVSDRANVNLQAVAFKENSGIALTGSGSSFLTIQGGYFSATDQGGILVKEDATLNLIDSQFEDFSTAVTIYSGAKKKHKIINTGFAKCRTGISLEGSSSVDITGSALFGCDIGIKTTDSAKANLAESTILKSAEYGVMMAGKSQIKARRSVFSDGAVGVHLGDHSSFDSSGCTWETFSQMVGQVSATATFIAVNDGFTSLAQGLVLADSAKVHISLCKISKVEGSWLHLQDTSRVEMKNSSLENAAIGLDITNGATVASNNNTFVNISDSAFKLWNTAAMQSERDTFKQGLHVISTSQTRPESIAYLNESKIEKHTGPVMFVAGQGKIIISKSNFDKEKQIVELKEAGVVEISSSSLEDISTGGITLTDQSKLIISKTSFNSIDESTFTIKEKSALTFNQVTFAKVKGPLVDARNSTTLALTDCTLSGISGPLATSGEQVTIAISQSKLSDFKTPIEISGDTQFRLTDVLMDRMKDGIRITGNSSFQANGLILKGPEKNALTIDSQGEIIIENSSVTSNDTGILIKGRSNNSFNKLEINAPNTGLSIKGEAALSATDLRITGSNTGVSISDKASLTLRSGSMTRVSKALNITGRSSATITGLTVSQSDEGVALHNESSLVLSDSQIQSSGTGITLNDNANLSGIGTTVKAKNIGLLLNGQSKIDTNNLGVLLRSSKGVGINAKGAPQGQINGLSVDGGKYAMLIEKSLSLVIKNIHLTNNDDAGFRFIKEGSANIEGGTIEGNPKGIIFEGNSKPVITGVTSINCDTGFQISNNAQPSLINCGVKGGKNGLLAEHTSKANINGFRSIRKGSSNNKGFGVKYTGNASGNLKEPMIEGPYATGILLEDMANPFIFGTTERGHIKNCTNGITVAGMGSPVIYNLLIEDNSKNGILLAGDTKPDNPIIAYIIGCRIRSHMGGAGIHVGKNGQANILGLARDGVNLPQIDTYYQNIIRSNLAGIKIVDNGEALIDGNMIENNGTGINLTKKSSASIHRNHIRESKFIIMDKGGIGVLVKDSAKIVMSDHNRIYKNRTAGIHLTTSAKGNVIDNNEIYENVDLPPGSKLQVNSLGAVMVNGPLQMDFTSNYIHNNLSAGMVVSSGKEITIMNNLFERNKRAALHLNKCKNFIVENNTFIGNKNNDVGMFFGAGVNSYGINKFSFQNNIFSKFSTAFNAANRITRIDSDWILRRNLIHSCEYENGSNLPDLLKNYKLDPIFKNPNGKGKVAFTPEPGSNVCDNSKIYDWGGSEYCGAFQCRKGSTAKEEVKLAIMTPQTDGSIVPRKLAFKANVLIPEDKDIASWELYVNENLITQSRGVGLIKTSDMMEKGVDIETMISSLPYGRSQIRLEVNSSRGEQWTANRTVYTASCSETHKRWVVLVGISDYSEEGGVPDLTYASADAMALGKILNRRSPYSPSQDVEVITLTDEQATREGLREVLFGKIAPCVKAEDEVIIFFAGHGAVEQDRFYLVLHDSDLNRLELTGYEMQELRDVIRYNIKSDNIMLMFDACHSGGITHNRVPANVLNNQLHEMTTTMDNLNIITASQGSEQSFEFSDCCLEQVNGKCPDDAPFAKNGHGAFTCTLLHAMTGYGMEDEKRQMSFADISSYISDWLPQVTDQQQHPQVLGNSYKEFDVTTIPTH